MRATILLAAGLVVLRLPTLTEPQWYSDDGFFLAVAWAMAKGATLYGGVFDNSPPGIYWLFRGLVALGAADRYWIVQAYATLAVVASALLVLALGRRFLPFGAALLAAAVTGVLLSIPTFDGDILNVELAGLPFFVAGLALAYRRSLWAAAAAGALAAIAVVFRPSYAVDAAALLVPLLTLPSPAARLVAAAAGAAGVLVLTVAAMAATGALSGYQALVMPADRGYLLWANGGSLAPVALRLLALAAVAALLLSRSRTPGARLAAVWAPAALAGASLTPREFTHYAHEAIPALAFASALLASRFRRRLPAYATAAAATLAAVPLLLVLPAWQVGRTQGAAVGWRPSIAFASLPGYYSNWALYVAGRRSASQYDGWFPGYRSEQAAASVVRAHAATGERVIVVGDRPWLFVHAGLLPGSRYLATNSAFWQVASAPATLRDELRSGAAALVVVAPDGTPWEADVKAGPYVEAAAGPWPVFQRR